MVETGTLVSSDRPFALDELALVERDHILRELEEQFTGLVTSLNVCVAIEGAWGMGRSALLEALGRTAERSGYVVLDTGGARSDRDDAFGVLRRLVERARSLHGDNADAQSFAAEVLRIIGRDGERGLEAISTAFGELLSALRATGPVLVAIDAADLVDDATMQTLSLLCQRVDDSHVWLLIALPLYGARLPSRTIDELLVRHFVRRVTLAPLSRDGVARVLAGHFGVEPPPEFIDAVLDASGGRPEFVRELLTAYQGEGHSLDDARHVDLASLRLEQLTRDVSTRVNQLTPGAREVFEVCVVGEPSERTAVFHLVDAEVDRSARDVLALQQAELLRADGPLEVVAPVVGWALRHQLTPSRRSELHERWANHPASNEAGDAAYVRHMLATESRWSASATKQIRKAAKRLLEQGDIELAERCLRRAVDECAAGEESSLWLDVAECEIRLGRPSSVATFQAALARGAKGDRVIAVALLLMDKLRGWPSARTEGIALLQSLSRHLGAVDPTSQLRFELGLTLLAGHPAQRNFDVARIEGCLLLADHDTDTARLAKLFVDVNHCEEDATATASEIADRFGSAFVENPMPIDDPVGEAVLIRVSRLLLHSDQFAAVDEFLEVARRRAFAAGDVALEVDALRLIVLSNLWQGSLDRASEALGRHDELCAATDRQPVIGSSELFIAQDRLDEALHRFALNDLERIADPLEYAKALVERGRLLNAAARADEAFETFERARAVVHRAGLNLEALVAWRASMAEALALLGRWEQAVALASGHLHAARTFGAQRALGVAFRTMAAVTQERDARARWLSEAIETLEGSPLRLDLASALIDLGALNVERGERDNARTLLEQGLELASACKAERLVRLAGAHLASLGTHGGGAGDVGVAFVYS